MLTSTFKLLRENLKVVGWSRVKGKFQHFNDILMDILLKLELDSSSISTRLKRS